MSFTYPPIVTKGNDDDIEFEDPGCIIEGIFLKDDNDRVKGEGIDLLQSDWVIALYINITQQGDILEIEKTNGSKIIRITAKGNGAFEVDSEIASDPVDIK